MSTITPAKSGRWPGRRRPTTGFALIWTRLLGTRLRWRPLRRLHQRASAVQVLHASSYLYPDLSVVCGEAKFNDAKTPENLQQPDALSWRCYPSRRPGPTGARNLCCIANCPACANICY
ncbi:MAG: hypothetical protein WKG07_21605 [Hymenobacter sp.]